MSLLTEKVPFKLTALLHEKQNEELAAKPASELRDMIAALQNET